MSPWLDLVLIIIFFVIVESRIILQPGVVIDLPSAEFAGGLRSRMTLVLLSIEGSAGKRDEVAFFDDERYSVRDEKRMTALDSAFAKYAEGGEDLSLTVYADKTVRHGTVTRFVEMARLAGIKRINMATEPTGGVAAPSEAGAE